MQRLGTARRPAAPPLPLRLDQAATLSPLLELLVP